MRYVELLENELVEARAAPLYHGTSMFCARKIIETNTIEARTSHLAGVVGVAGDSLAGVSLSRNLRVSKTFGPVVFVLDQAKLTTRQKMIPIDYWHMNAAFKRSNERSGTSEAEEFVVGPIPDLDRYLLEILVSIQQFEIDSRRPECKETLAILSDSPKMRLVEWRLQRW